MGEVINLAEYRQKIEKQKEAAEQKEIEELQLELESILQELISENNVSFCEDPVIMWYNINEGDDQGDQPGYYFVTDPFYLDVYGSKPDKQTD